MKIYPYAKGVPGSTVIKITATRHVGTVAILSKLDVDKHISVEINMEEMDITSAEAKGTYKEIKEYIWNKHKIKVSSLYIAQIKRDHGIIERDNYNVSKKEDATVPQCPPEKEKVIVEALKYFKMIDEH